MFWGIIHRMILVDLIKIFLIALVALTGLILMAGIVAEAMKNGLGPMQILYAIPLMLPSMLPYTVPTTTLFATCIVYGRLSADNEILALKAAGVHILHVILPALLLGFATAAVTVVLYIDTIPYTTFLLRCQVVGDVEELLYTMLRKDQCIVHRKLNFEMFVGHMVGQKLFDVDFRKRSADGKSFDVIAKAKEAEMRVDQKNMKVLIDMRQCEILQLNGMNPGGGIVESRIWEVEIPDINGPLTKSRTAEMTWHELLDNQHRLRTEKQKLGQQIDVLLAAQNMGALPSEQTQLLENLINERKHRDSQLFAIDNERHMRIAFSLGCICFALVGCPVGIWFSKSDYLSAFITCFLPIVTLYYPLMLCTINMGRSGRIPPILGVYDADLILLTAGLILFRKLARN